MIKTEIIIVGAGLAGLAAANYLQKLGISYIIIDRNKTAKITNTDTRTTAVNFNLCQNFQFLGIWNDIEQYAAPIKRIVIRNNHSESEAVFSDDMTEFSPMGYIIPNTILKKALINKLDQNKFIENQEVLDIQTSNHYVIAETKKIKIRGKLILVADGKFSKLKQLFNIDTITHNYKQKSYVFNIKQEKNHNNMALEQFLH